jgi:hypothetical protein
MGHIEATRHLWVTPDALWAAVTDLPNWDKWLTMHRRWLTEPPAVLTPGATLVSKVMVLGRVRRMTWYVTDVDAPSRFVVSGTGVAGLRCDFEIRISPTEDGSEFTLSGDFRGDLIDTALGSAMEKDGNRQLSCALQRLDALAATA